MRLKNCKRLLSTIVLLLMVVLSFSACKSSNTSSDVDSDISTKPAVSSEDTESTSSEEQQSAVQSSVVSEPQESSSKPTQATPSSSTSVPSTPVESTPTKIETPVESEAPKPQTPQELIIGKWVGIVDIAPMLIEMGFDTQSPLNMTYTVEFTNSGTMVESIDRTSYNSILDTVMEQTIAEEIANMQITRGEYEQLFYQENGMTVSEYLDSVKEELSTMMDAVGTYKFADDILLIKESGSSVFVETDYSFSDEDSLSITQEGMTIDFDRV